MPLALVALSCLDGEPADYSPHCVLHPYIAIDATAGSLVVHASPDDLACPDLACFEACPVEGEVDGVEMAVCRPAFREEGTPASASSFVIDSYPAAPETEIRTMRRVVRIASSTPDLTFSFELPDVRSLDAELAWSSPLYDPRFRQGPCNVRGNRDALSMAGRLRVVSRTGGAAGEGGVTDDYHAVVEVSGRIEAVVGSNVNGPCLFLPATEFSFTYEEDEVSPGKSCIVLVSEGPTSAPPPSTRVP